MRPPLASTNRRVSVAIPERRCRKLSAVRSAVSIGAARPRSSATTSPGWQRSPSCDAERNRAAGIELTKRLGGDVDPGEDAWRLREDDAPGAHVGSDGRIRRHVSPAEIFGERAPDGLAIERRLERLERNRLHRRGSPACDSAGASSTHTSSDSPDSRSRAAISPAARRSVSAAAMAAHDPHQGRARPRPQHRCLQRALFLGLLLADRAEDRGRELQRPDVGIALLPAPASRQFLRSSASAPGESILAATTTRLLR